MKLNESDTNIVSIVSSTSSSYLLIGRTNDLYGMRSLLDKNFDFFVFSSYEFKMQVL